MEQLSLPEPLAFAPPPSAHGRSPSPGARPFVFFCILPTPADAAATAERARALFAGGDAELARRLLPESRLHMTLNPLGLGSNADQPFVAGLRAAAARVSVDPFDLVLERAMSFGREGVGGRHALVLRPAADDAGAQALRTAIEISMETVGFEVPPRSFTPHVTLLYDRRYMPERRIEPVVWRVRHFSLILSLRGQSTYIPLGRWPLRSA